MQVATKHRRLNLKNRRIAVGTQRKVANDLGITEAHWREIENGNSAPGTELLFKICIYLNASVYDIFPDLVNLSFFNQNSN